MYSQQGFPNSLQNQWGSTGSVQSQYRGYETKYQPVGFVQSQYNQSGSQPGMGQQHQYGASQPSYSQFQSPQSYHTASYHSNQQQPTPYVSPHAYHMANYHHDQQGHDGYLRSDSQQPLQSQFGTGTTSYTSQNQFSQGGSGQQQLHFQPPSSYHMAHYRGNQPSYDTSLRSDSPQLAQSQFFSTNSIGYNKF